ncbi:Gfo/Idh/MocA family oxidoreductase [Actinomadura sp. 7K507]|uniref:Gfo/Idh/MocA family protein n=1 Tax=Actinomadura sp. 7K507 TaxID=2530365 RepID=UPI001048F88A|nr:Gfo/Idh/MocA family oxidoreductase [Actinomadura sp. 7K507]TDC84770.1 Gfo/Idh/MocA family oxidoreductase [Actinomadura sp. 7K507]
MRVGVVGLKRGLHLAAWCLRLGMDVVIACDRDAGPRSEARESLPGTVIVGDWRELLELRLDGVVLANDFDEHAPLAIAFLERGVHVLSEAAACKDGAEGRRLIEAVERSSATYSFAENYVFHPHVRLIRQAVDGGELGRITLVEADYLHGMSPEDVTALVGDPAHWRGRIAATAYCTHTVSPVLALTGAWPVEVSAFSVDESEPRAAVVLVVRLSNGALAVTKHGFLQGEPGSHWSWVSARGTKALAESVRGPAERSWSVRVQAEGWTRPDGVAREEERTPPALHVDGKAVERGAEGDVLLLEGFRATVEKGEPPLVPVRAAVAASLVGVAGATSLNEGSRPVRVPDVRG